MSKKALINTKEHLEFKEAMAKILEDMEELNFNLNSSDEEVLAGTLLECNFVIAAWGTAARAYDICIQKFQKGEEFNPQDEMLTQFVVLKEKEIRNYKKVYMVRG